MILLLLAGSLLTAADDKKKVQVVCPVDAAKFEAFEVVTTNEWGGVDFDFCPHAFKTTPLEFYVWVCPACGFAGRKKDFETPLGSDDPKALRESLRPPSDFRKGARQDEIPGRVKYELLAQVARIRKRPPKEVGNAYLHASWSCRQQGAVYLDAFDEWEALRTSYGLNRPPLELGKKNRTEYDLEIARKIEKDLEAGKQRGLQKILALYTVAYLYRKHGENLEAGRALAELEKLKGENSVVDDAVRTMKESVAREQSFQKLALEAYSEALRSPALDKGAANDITYLLGELCRRTGDPAAASWYDKVLETADSEPLKKLAADQKSKLSR